MNNNKTTWQPIETAPKDGTWMLVYWDTDDGWLNPDGPKVELARWLSKEECTGGRRYWEPHFVSVGHEAHHLTGMTKWMPFVNPKSV